MPSQFPLVDSKHPTSIRPYRESDIQPIYNLVRQSIPEIAPWMSWCHENYAVAETEIWVHSRAEDWKARNAFSFVIESMETGEPVGTCGLSHINWLHQFANLGYWVGTPFMGKGHATAASRLLAEWAFRTQELVRLEIVVALENHPSLRVAQKLGAHPEGIQRNRLTTGTQIQNAHMFSLIPEDLIL